MGANGEKDANGEKYMKYLTYKELMVNKYKQWRKAFEDDDYDGDETQLKELQRLTKALTKEMERDLDYAYTQALKHYRSDEAKQEVADLFETDEADYILRVTDFDASEQWQWEHKSYKELYEMFDTNYLTNKKETKQTSERLLL